MKKILSVLLLIFCFSCDDGDLQIESIDFSAGTIQTCETVDVAQPSILFKINSDEALILSLAANVFKNEEGTVALELTSTTASTIIYRLFSGTVTNTYFCSDIPPTSPTVQDEIVATTASITITTTLDTTATVPTYTHLITITKITLETGNDQRITTIGDEIFGTITTN